MAVTLFATGIERFITVHKYCVPPVLIQMPSHKQYVSYINNTNNNATVFLILLDKITENMSSATSLLFLSV